METHGLVSTLVAAIVLAFVFGFLAQRLRLSPIVGYLLAGIAVGPHTPGFVAETEFALQLSEIGVILLMFGVGLKISVEDIWAVRGVAVPGSILQMVAAAIMGTGAGVALNMPLAEAVILGISLSIASTIVFMRVMEERRLLKSEEGRIGISWLLVEDLVIVLAIVVLPALVSAMATGEAVSPLRLLGALGITFIKIAVFVAAMLLIGARFFPWLIVRIAHAKSRELLSLGTLALALGVAWAAYYWFDASFALGAFLAGLALNGSKFSHRVAEESLPLRDTFAVIFFVAVGMLFDPMVLIEEPLGVAAIVLLIVAGKAILGYIPMRMLRQSHEASLLIAIGSAQIGEFSFVLAGLGVQLEVMTMDTYSLILAGSIFSIALNPILMRLVPHITPHPEVKPEPVRASA